jgi:hypothetical protein
MSDTSAAVKVHDESEQDVRAWLETLAADAAIKIAVSRRSPRTYRGHNIEGQLDTIEELIDEDYIRERWGGGKYLLKVMTPNSRGQYLYRVSRTVSIAGDPKIGDLVEDYDDGSDAGARESDAATITAMNTMAKLVQEQRNRPALDPDLIRTFTGPLQSQIARQDDEIRELRILAQQRPDNSHQERLLERMIGGESARVEAITAQYQSELRTVKENHHRDMADARAQAKDDLAARERSHERELMTLANAHAREMDALRQAFETRLETSKLTYEARIEAQKTEQERVRGDLAEVRAEAAALRAKKDKGLIEQAKELSEVREALSALGGGGDDDEKPWYEKALAMAEPIAGRIMSGLGDAGPMMQQPMQMPPQALQRRRRVVHARPQTMAAPPRLQRPAPVQGPAIDAADVASAIQYMESAVQSGADPAAFAASARNLIPSNILQLVASVGIDEFLAKVAQLSQDSPLRSQVGRNFARDVAKQLLGAK